MTKTMLESEPNNFPLTLSGTPLTQMSNAHAYFQILSLCAENYRLRNKNARARAKGMYEALSVLRWHEPSLPEANLGYLQSLPDRHGQDHPIHESQWHLEAHHWRQILGLGNSQISRSHRESATQDAKQWLGLDLVCNE